MGWEEPVPYHGKKTVLEDLNTGTVEESLVEICGAVVYLAEDITHSWPARRQDGR